MFSGELFSPEDCFSEFRVVPRKKEIAPDSGFETNLRASSTSRGDAVRYTLMWLESETMSMSTKEINETTETCVENIVKKVDSLISREVATGTRRKFARKSQKKFFFSQTILYTILFNIYVTLSWTILALDERAGRRKCWTWLVRQRVKLMVRVDTWYWHQDFDLIGDDDLWPRMRYNCWWLFKLCTAGSNSVKFEFDLIISDCTNIFMYLCK